MKITNMPKEKEIWQKFNDCKPMSQLAGLLCGVVKMILKFIWMEKVWGKISKIRIILSGKGEQYIVYYFKIVILT